MASLADAIDVQLSWVLVMKAFVGAPLQYCASTWTGSGTSCEPFALRMASRPKRICLSFVVNALPSLNEMPLPAVAVAKRAGLVARLTPSASITLIARLISASYGEAGAVGVLRVKKIPVPEPKVSVPVPKPAETITGSVPGTPRHVERADRRRCRHLPVRRSRW